MVKNIILLGPPGTGKGTLAKFLVKNQKMIHLSTGDIFRSEIANKTPLGIQVEKILQNGDYVSDQITNQIIQKAVEEDQDKKKGFIFDGYPRTINQAKFLEEINFVVFKVVYLDLDKKNIVKRLLNRNRKDDTLEIIENRFKIYTKQTAPLVNYYQNQNKLLKLDVSGTPEQNYLLFLKEVLNGDD